ncbi:MAG TPA: hypothetical protein VF630_13350 [Hymenobacter sp.]|jgi:hypothetical protein
MYKLVKIYVCVSAALTAFTLGLLLVAGCATSYRSTAAPKTMSEAQRRAAQREVRRYYNPSKRQQLLRHE